MLNFNFYMPGKIVSGINCVKDNAELFKLGSKALLVTGKSSAVKSGAQADVIEALEKLGIGYVVYNKIGENPLVSVAEAGGRYAIEQDCDFVIGIGGGSAMDASKAVAAYAANPEISGVEIFGKLEHRSLPIIAIPTTSGTGSEANVVSVLSIDGQNKKQSFKSEWSFPRASFLDPRYTGSLPYSYTLSTALDAFCHCIESYLSPKSTEVSELFALYGGREIFNELKQLSPDREITAHTRERLMSGACAGGIAINTTGTGFPHPLGYNLTMFLNIPHGRACGAFTGEYVGYVMRDELGKQRLETFAKYIGSSAAEIAQLIPELAAVDIRLDDAEIDKFVNQTANAGNYKNCFYVIDERDMHDIYARLFKA